MGLGKTIQALALLASRLASRRAKQRKPSIVVVPRSLMFNWQAEAARFTPGLELFAYLGPSRAEQLGQLGAGQVLLTTYGTLRRDIAKLATIEFDYAILDESQAIKNPRSQSAKACRLLRAEHRLAMSGTPVENHLGELASLLEFLNPGLVGSVDALQALVQSHPPDKPSLNLLSRALRPFILRRTKSEVLDELPPKTEQVLWVELEHKQRRRYDELRDHYRANLSERLEDTGLKSSTVQLLQALLRLRQAACHPGLLEGEYAHGSSAKLDVLLDNVRGLVQTGHKAIVFSQFTSLLGIVRQQLERHELGYAYLDGQTRKRQIPVQRFQTDPDCGVFLISLKAGGQGLNLTAGDYVFLLDPWWNPAVEAQAIDRAHRIGQHRPVFAYRLIAKDTVEEKVLQLQQTKRELADALFGDTKSFVGALTREDVATLLS